MKKRKKNYGRELFYEFLFFVLAIVLVVKFWEEIFLLTLLLAGMWAIAIKLWHSKKDVTVFIVSAILGPIAEILIINFGGAWYYSAPVFFGIPPWLPILWGFTGLLLYRFANSFYDLDRVGKDV